MTPIDVAAAYTPFATNGFRAEPLYLRAVLAADGTVEETGGPRVRAVLDPRVAFLTTSIMEDVINRGTGVTVRSMGFTPDAAGRPAPRAMAGSRDSLRICSAWCG